MMDAFDRALDGRGAVRGELHGAPAVLHFGDPTREWRAAREGAAIIPATYRTLVAATGDDRTDFLQGMLTNDLKAVAPGGGMYAALLTEQGRVVTDLRVFVEPERILLDVLAWRAEALRQALEKFIVADDVELAPAAESPLVILLGPMAAAVLAETTGGAELPRGRYEHVASAFAGEPVRIMAVHEAGVDAFLVAGVEAAAAPLFESCVLAGAVPMGRAALEMVRIERGVPWAGIDMDESTLLMETGCEAAISFTKGCYLGQEVVERIAARGHVNRHLTGVVFDGPDAAPSGARLLADAREVGYVTSTVQSPALGRPIGLAMVQRKYAPPGTRLAIDTGGTATVTALPFVPGLDE